MAKKVVFIGGPGSGKSTVTTEVFVELKKKNKNCELVTEWIRQDIQANGPMESIWEQYRTRDHQKEIEDAIPDEVEYVLIDSGTLTQFFYACLYCDHSDARQRLVMADMYKYFLDDVYLKRYDHVFYLPCAQTYELNVDILNDGTRYQSEYEAETVDKHMGLMFARLHIGVGNITVLDCPLEKRTKEALKIIK